MLNSEMAHSEVLFQHLFERIMEKREPSVKEFYMYNEILVRLKPPMTSCGKSP
jgi:hypothetical protein